MKTRCEKAATARSTIAAAPAMARSIVARCLVAAARRGLNGWAAVIGEVPSNASAFRALRSPPRQARWTAAAVRR
jgi:hypothetical protein